MSNLKIQLENHPELRKHLFEKGYLITDANLTDTKEYPMYGNWEKVRLGIFDIWTNKNVNLFSYRNREKIYFLIGHAFNPFTMQYDENELLKHFAEIGDEESDNFYEALNELTGVFILGIICNSDIRVVLDASGMQYGCYGTVNGKRYISSHMRLIGDLCNLQETDYVRRLVNYRWYHFMMGNYLPGDLSCYSEVKRIVPNTVVKNNNTWTIHRFYPNCEISMCQTKEEYQQVISEAARIMQNTMALIPYKWENPAISLTGGIDSNTTFAAANGVYEKYQSFSYVSMYRESVDAKYASEISERFSVKHKEYLVPESNDVIPNFGIYKAIFEYNHGGIGSYKDSDIRKKVTLIQNDVCDVEVKSWISETIRAYAYKYFGRTKFPNRLRARNYTSLFKIFAFNRRLALETDHYFREYLKKTDLKKHLFNYDESDFFVWEMMHGGKCGLDIGVMKSCFDITIPYNNRKLLDLLLRVPLEYRLSDQHHLDLKKTMNKELYDMNIRVVNLNETNLRKKAANVYYTIHSLLPL